MTKADVVYTKYEGLEERLAHSYFVLHERFISDPGVAGFWAQAALDEMQHSSLLRFCHEHSLITDEDADVEADLEVAERIEDLLDTVKTIVSDPDVTVDDAFCAALLIESSEMDDMFEKLTVPLAKGHWLLYQAIRASLRGHYDKFADAAEKFCRDRSYVEAFRNLGRAERLRLARSAG